MNDVSARALSLVGDVSGLLDIDEFRAGLLAALGTEIPCRYVSLNQVSPDPARTWSVTDPPLAARHHDAFRRLALQNPIAEWHMRTLDGRPLRFSDIVTRAQLKSTELYREVYAEIGLEYQVAFTLPSAGPTLLAVALSRTETDFSDEERNLLALARPHLIQAYRNALEFAGPRDVSSPGPDEEALRTLGLTAAQTRVLARLATGLSTAAIADDLQIAQRTVHKHLQRIYTKLGVADRSAAAQVAWRAATDPADQSRIVPHAATNCARSSRP